MKKEFYHCQKSFCNCQKKNFCSSLKNVLLWSKSFYAIVKIFFVKKVVVIMKKKLVIVKKKILSVSKRIFVIVIVKNWWLTDADGKKRNKRKREKEENGKNMGGKMFFQIWIEKNGRTMDRREKKARIVLLIPLSIAIESIPTKFAVAESLHPRLLDSSCSSFLRDFEDFMNWFFLCWEEKKKSLIAEKIGFMQKLAAGNYIFGFKIFLSLLWFVFFCGNQKKWYGLYFIL